MRVILAFSGGGARGVLSAATWGRADVQALVGRVDMIAGTSTGALIALQVAIGRSPQEILDAYLRHIPGIFARPWHRKMFCGLMDLFKPKYGPDGLERAALQIFGMRSIDTCRVPTVITAANLDFQRPKVWKSWLDDELMLAVVRGTAAAPTFFAPSDQGMVDGGTWANRPVLVALGEARKMWPGEKIRVVCIGTGKTTHYIRPSRAYGWGLLGWSLHIVDVLMNANAPAASYLTEILADEYVELDPWLNGIDASLDRCDPEHLQRLVEIGKGFEIATERVKSNA